MALRLLQLAAAKLGASRVDAAESHEPHFGSHEEQLANDVRGVSAQERAGALRLLREAQDMLADAAGAAPWSVARGRFAGRGVVVTGGAKGIGEGCTRVFAREGGRVAVLDRDAAAADALVDELNGQHGDGKAIALPCDASDPAAVTAAVREACGAFGRMDAVVNNVGWHPPATAVDDVDVDDFEALYRLNVTSALAATKAALPELRASRALGGGHNRCGGAVVLMSSMTSVLGQRDATAYVATKGALNALAKSLAVDLARDGVRVNAVLPSNVLTPLWMEWVNTLDDPQAGLDSGAAKQALGYMADIEEMGSIALFLATPDASFITGQVIHADGGVSLDF